MLLEGRCAVSRVPAERFSLDRFGHPGRRERGKSYSWSAGIIDDLWDFDPTVFGISPREAEQMDPQQRILLQLTWEALEDAGIKPSSIAKSSVGVYVGASQTDYGHAFFSDPAIADAHFATGTALAILANRISYIYDFRGPSVSIDTACSSSLVALHEAVAALQSGRIDTAIVGGSNIIASPASFIAFSQANMLSPTGLCRAFSAEADGFVRGEGAVVLVLRQASHALAERNPAHGYVLASDVNSDGRTGGISLPSIEAQEDLLRRVYSRAGIDPDRLAFVEAHGTGTPIGDPVEATAIGQGVGMRRSGPLPIGSIKSNIGHLEPASGLAGVLKALLALNHGILPPSLHVTEPNPNIDFARLNLTVCQEPLLLSHEAQRIAGVNSFGFGGTNAHAVVAAGRREAAVPKRQKTDGDGGVFMFSAESDSALLALAQDYADRVNNLSDEETANLAAAAVHRREHLSKRVVISSVRSREVARALGSFIAGTADPLLESGVALGRSRPAAFVYSGNGSQWVGMGVSAYRNNTTFRAQFDRVDGHFRQFANWSLKQALFSDDLADRLGRTSVAQPLIFAIQSASTAALETLGLRPAAVLGHSVGEVAAAEAAKILDLAAAVKIVHFRSARQELVQGIGRMAAVLAPADTAQELARAVGGVEIAAINSARAVTIAGPADALAEFKALAESRRIALLDLDLDYPFHTSLMEPIRPKLTADLHNMAPRSAEVPFISTVTGEVLAGSQLGGAYWWRNVREPVQFAKAVKMAAKLGIRFFVEIGPRATLHKHIADTLQGEANDVSVLSVLDRNETDSDADPFAIARSKALVRGAQVSVESIVGGDPGAGVMVPNYPWQRQQFRFKPTVEALASETKQHPFAGMRLVADGTEWRGHIDTNVFPMLADHKLGEQTIFPGAGFLEIALAVAAQWLQRERVALTDFEILSPLDLTNGATREILTRVSPGASSFEIFSRPRLSKSGWTLHSRGKILTGDLALGILPNVPPSEGHVVDGLSLYRIASTSGLPYGPAFRLALEARLYPENVIDVRLAPPDGSDETRFLLDPMRLDCSAHGVFSVFPELRYEERGITYIPIRIDEVLLYRPQAVAVRAIDEIVSKNERSIVTNIHLYDRDDNVIAILRNVRSQAVNVRRASRVETFAVVETTEPLDGELIGRTGVRANVGSLVACARDLGLVAKKKATKPQGLLLLEAWAMAAAYEITSALAGRSPLDLDVLVASGRLPEQLRNWLTNILMNLESAGLATQSERTWSLVRDAALPPSHEVVKALAAEQPALAAELALAGAVSGLVQRIALNRAMPRVAEFDFPNAAINFFHATHVGINDAADALDSILAEAHDVWPKRRALRVLHVGYSPLLHKMAAWVGGKNASITLFEPDQAQYDRARAAVAQVHRVTLVNAEQVNELGTYDLILSAEGLHRLPANMSLADIKAWLAPSGVLLAVEPQPSLFMDLVFGLDAAWFRPTADWRPISPILSAEDWISSVKRTGLADADVQQLQCRFNLPCLLIAKNAAASGVRVLIADNERKSVRLVAADDQTQSAKSLLEALRASPAAAIVRGGPDLPDSAADIVVLLPPALPANANPVDALSQRCMLIKSCAELVKGQTTLWLVFAGALAVDDVPVRPIETGAWAFSRTLANELQNLDIRRLDVSPDVSIEQAAGQIAKLILSGTAETELHFDGSGLRAVRADRLERVLEKKAGTHKAPAKLERRAVAGQRVSWQPMKRLPPQPNDVEIEVEASGLNFRDLMWALGLLPDDVLEDGLTGPTLGIECAGRVSRIGSSVKGLTVGDRVMAFAGSSLATHVTVPAKHALKVPAAISCEAAATIPVAFFTSYYSLVTLAALKRREWVLIHGGAGAVGLAAIQIAVSRGARVIATAGSPAKRDLLRSLGIHYVFDSRSTSFVDQVRNVTEGGVHVVLNSLSGEAMERSIACLRPFGRFVELGKRDYIANSHVGLRPFRKNLSYFGVDVDQLIVGREALSQRVYAQMMREFANGTLVPLPYSVANVTEAFQLMQQSAHIGKLVVRPPAVIARSPAGKNFTIDAKGTHVITGAFGGFGLETVKWLIEQGARNLVLIGRRGPVTPEARAVLQAPGVKIMAEPCDVSDLSALERLFDKVRATMPPIVGVIHAAMVLDDAIVANLDAERFRRVLAPKAAGAENLEAATRGQSLDYFVMFSSVTTLLGNPGQGNYVAGNAYMEGMARRRRQQGLPALAIGWGPIIDVGVVAENERLQAGLQKLTGVIGMRAREALEFMVQALEQSTEQLDFAAMTISPWEGSLGGGRLAVLRSPTYGRLIGQNEGHSGADADRVDLHAVAASEGVEAVRRIVGNVIVSKLAHVLHARDEDISRVRPLGEIGLDSLMALELALILEKSFDIHVPLAGASGAKSVADIADEITEHVCAEYDREDEFVATIAEHHHKDIQAGQAEALKVLASETPKTKRVLS
jgi:acyl transferase domain-containing protein/NADPH:quinone reductase-like Zn-dependent oxidoreductase/acyl carrier protein